MELWNCASYIPQRTAAASLKPGACRVLSVPPAPDIPQRTAAASLKLLVGEVGDIEDMEYSAANRCGLIEAIGSLMGSLFHAGYSAANRCGLIEALSRTSPTLNTANIPQRTAAASLKLMDFEFTEVDSLDIPQRTAAASLKQTPWPPLPRTVKIFRSEPLRPH